MQVYPFTTNPTWENARWARSDWPFNVNAPMPSAMAHLINANTTCADNDQPLAARVDQWGADLLGRAAPAGHIPFTARWIGTSSHTPIFIAEGEAAHKAWYIVEADDDATICRGLKPGASIDEFAHACTTNDDRAGAMLNSVPVRRGQCYYIPADTPHAIGSGVVLAEIQSASIRTIALPDTSPTIKTQIKQGIARADTSAVEKKSHVTSLFTTVTRLITTPTFYIERVRFMGELEQDIPYAELVIWLVLEGTGAVLHGRNQSLAFEPGHCVILPANLRDARLRTDTDCVWLEITVPAESDLAAYPRPDADYLQASEGTPQHPIPLNISIDKKK